MLFPYLFLAAASVASGGILRRADPPFQTIPTTAKPDNTFSNGAPMLASEPPQVPDVPPEVYGARSIDLPFGRLYHGDMKFFSAGQLNSPDGITDAWMGQPGVIDSANQSACGIPDNAFSISKVAIHPYFLKYADLSRYCMQDVCISFWNGKQAGHGQSDMMLKVTDICSTDPNDPTHCAKPGDIKIDRTKAKIMEQLGPAPLEETPQVMGSQFYDGVSSATSETWWFFTKCWADALVQPAYGGSANNWFSTPSIPNNLDWSQNTATQQYQNNQVAYAAKTPAWPKYPNGAYNPNYNDVTSPPISDWSPTDPDTIWCPVAGGKGWGKPTGNCNGDSSQESSGTETPKASSSSTATVSSSVAPAGNGASSTTAVVPQSSPASSTASPAVVPAPSSNGTTVTSPSLQGSSADKNAKQVAGGEGEDDTCEW